MKKNYETIIIGGGIIGCGIAFELAKRGKKDILLIERKYITAGNTGKCGAGMRLQWGSEINATLARDSMDIFDMIEDYTEYNEDCGVNHSGYMLLAHDEAEYNLFLKNMEVQHKLGIDSIVVDLDNINDIVPGMNTEGIYGATFCQRDGSANPFHCTLAYYQAARRRGVEFSLDTAVEDFIVEKGRIKGVRTNRGDFMAVNVINATNTWAPGLAKLVGDDVPIYAERHECVITEPVAPMGAHGRMMPMLLSWKWVFFFQQTYHGSFIGGSIPTQPVTLDTPSPEFLEETGYIVTRTVPALRGLRVLRHWSGHFDNSPDHTPIINFSKKAEGLCTICGFSGHGFMIAPRTVDMVARHYCGEDDNLDIMKFCLERYETGDIFVEPAVHSVAEH